MLEVVKVLGPTPLLLGQPGGPPALFEGSIVSGEEGWGKTWLDVW